MRRLAPLALVALAAITLPRATRAQELATPAVAPATETPAASAQPLPAGPTMDGATVALKRQSSEQTLKAPVVVASQHTDKATALMIVGGAAFLAGAIMNDDPGTIIMVGGVAVGLYGLYLYLQ